MSADLCFTRDSFFFFFFFAADLQAHWTELNQNWPHAQKSLRFENACPKSGVSPLPTNRGPKNNLFGQLRNLTATLTAYILGTKRDIDNQSSALTTTGGLLRRPKMS